MAVFSDRMIAGNEARAYPDDLDDRVYPQYNIRNF